MKKTNVKKNYLYQLVYQLLNIMMGFLTSPYIARVLGAEGVGQYSYSYSVAYYFVLFSMLGILNYGSRIIAQVRDDRLRLNRIYSSLLSVHLILSAFCTVVYFVYAVFFSREKLYALIQGLYVLSGVFDISWFYFGIEQFRTTVIRSIIIKMTSFACIFIFVKDADDVALYCLIMAMGYLISQMALWLPIRKYVSWIRPSWTDMKVHFKPMFILFIPAIAVSLYKYMDKIMLGYLSGNTQLGYYENAEKLNNMPLTFISSFGTVMLPKMSNIVANREKDSFTRYIRISMQFVLFLAMAFAFGLTAVAPVFAPVFWGKAFTESGRIIMGLSVTIPFIAFANVIRTQYLIPAHKDKIYMSSVLTGAIINLLINSLLIPRIGAMGATLGTIAAEGAVCIFQTAAVWKQLDFKAYLPDVFGFFAAGACMYFVVRLVAGKYPPGVTVLLIEIVFGIVSYLLFAFLYIMISGRREILDLSLNKIRRRKS